MGRRGKGKAVKKNQHRPGHGEEGDDMVKAPHSFVVPLGKTGKCVRELAADFRSVIQEFLHLPKIRESIMSGKSLSKMSSFDGNS